jgi:hypothetical protein
MGKEGCGHHYEDCLGQVPLLVSMVRCHVTTNPSMNPV